MTGRSADSRVPELMLIGPGRTGTTSLFNFLANDRRIDASAEKELQAFRPALRDQSINLSLYDGAFQGGEGRIRTEGSPSYFQGGVKIASQIMRFAPETRLVITLREPASRLVSCYNQVKNKVLFDDKLTFYQYLEKAKDVKRLGAQNDDDFHFYALLESDYTVKLEEWFSCFPRDRIHVSFYETVFEAQSGELDRLARFLGFEDGFDQGYELPRTNVAASVKSRWIHRLAIGLSSRVEPWLRRNPGLRATVRSAYYALQKNPHRHDEDPAQLLLQARKVLQEHCPRLSELAGALDTHCPETPSPAWVNDWAEFRQ